MRLSKQQTAENRRRIIEFATRLFQEHGFDRVGVAELMRAAGFTHGGFYNHFASKDALAAEACTHLFARGRATLNERLEARDQGAWAEHVRANLTPSAIAAPNDSTALAVLAGDAARQPVEVQAAFAHDIEQTLAALSGHAVRTQAASLGRRAARDQAVQQLSSFVGACVLARAIALASPALSSEILATSRRVAREASARSPSPKSTRR